LAVGDFLNPKNSPLNNLVSEVAVAHAWKQNPLFDLDQILQSGRHPDVITCANCGENRLRGLGLAGSQICPSPLTLIVALTTLSHYRASV